MKNRIGSIENMKKYTRHLFLLIYVLFATALPIPSLANETATVTDVIDGDTIAVTLRDRDERVRLVGIDTPELHGAGAPECYAAEAKEKTKQLVLGKTVMLIPDGPSADRDRYDRLLRYVVVDGVNVNETLVREGYAPAYLTFKFEKKDAYTQLEAAAKSAQLGMWGAACDAREKDAAPMDTNSSNQVLVIVFIVGILVAVGLLPRSVLSKVLRSIKK